MFDQGSYSGRVNRRPGHRFPAGGMLRPRQLRSNKMPTRLKALTNRRWNGLPGSMRTAWGERIRSARRSRTLGDCTTCWERFRVGAGPVGALFGRIGDRPRGSRFRLGQGDSGWQLGLLRYWLPDGRTPRQPVRLPERRLRLPPAEDGVDQDPVAPCGAPLTMSDNLLSARTRPIRSGSGESSRARKLVERLSRGTTTDGAVIEW